MLKSLSLPHHFTAATMNLIAEQSGHLRLFTKIGPPSSPWAILYHQVVSTSNSFHIDSHRPSWTNGGETRRILPFLLWSIKYVKYL